MGLKVLKFGGTSVGTVKSITALKHIVEAEAKDSDLVVVVSALGGLTDRLIATADMARNGDDAYLHEVEAMQKRHHDMIDAVIAEDKKGKLMKYTDTLFDDLRNVYLDIFRRKELTILDNAEVVSFGERLSSRITATMIEGAEWFDSRKYIKTTTKHDKFLLNQDLTESLVKKTFKKILGRAKWQSQFPHVSVVPGFISSDSESDTVTNLGRGGSDFTAAIIAAVLDADVLEIWTDVDGFMTADPRIVEDAYTIDEMSYTEAMELCNHGAKIIYPPTLYPVCQKKIPICVKNTFAPHVHGTDIVNSRNTSSAKNMEVFCGLSNMKGITLIDIDGPSLNDVQGIHRRVASCLLEKGVEPLFIDSQERKITIGTKDADCHNAIQYLNREFENAIRAGRILPMTAHSGMATVTLVGEAIQQNSGLQARLVRLLSSDGINAEMFVESSEKNNITVVIEQRYLNKTLHILHQHLFK